MGRNGELIRPGSFVPIAERFDLISEIDRWVFSRAVILGAAGQHVEVNVSAQTMASDGFLSFVEQKLAAAGATPSNVVFEITETALMRDLRAGEVLAHGLAAIGRGLALDDFGTGVRRRLRAGFPAG
jgi:EAL domain-containing protein (putative c-di-GMP-specific phosphodiesterase class I)